MHLCTYLSASAPTNGSKKPPKQILSPPGIWRRDETSWDLQQHMARGSSSGLPTMRCHVAHANRTGNKAQYRQATPPAEPSSYTRDESTHCRFLVSGLILKQPGSRYLYELVNSTGIRAGSKSVDRCLDQ
uniref:Uncharacterized protein n=1 Tax=Bionectria ochroleuca TaxID=29856 RepID=A0A8H7NFS8_BIOOC